jgi:hypothetical protein
MRIDRARELDGAQNTHAKKAEEAYGGGGGDSGSRVLLERYRMEIQALRGQFLA